MLEQAMSWVPIGVAVYLGVLNLTGLLMMGWDKRCARRQSRRVPEKTLFLISALGGSAGTWGGMYLFRHKTKHWYFVWGMPILFFLHLALIGWILWQNFML